MTWKEKVIKRIGEDQVMGAFQASLTDLEENIKSGYRAVRLESVAETTMWLACVFKILNTDPRGYVNVNTKELRMISSRISSRLRQGNMPLKIDLFSLSGWLGDRSKEIGFKDVKKEVKSMAAHASR